MSLRNLHTYLSIFLLVYSCGIPENSSHISKIKLASHIGIISLAAPEKLDTFYEWVYVSDCGPCCHEKWYRLANKKYSLLEESGSYDSQIPDSIFQLTISHKNNPGCDNNFNISQVTADSITKKVEKNYYDSFDGEKEINWIIKKLEKINGQNFILLGYESNGIYANLGQMTTIEAITLINKEIILFKYECSGVNCRDFFEEAMESLYSLKFRSPIVSRQGTMGH